MSGVEVVRHNEFMRVEVGSTLHGMAVDNGMDDRDEMGLCIEGPEYVMGLEHFEQYIFRTAELREGKDARSRAGDVDLIVYSLRKWMRLACQGNPSILLLLFAPGNFWVLSSPLGRRLQALAPAIVSKQAGARFAGYLDSQKQRLLRERGTAHVPNRGDKDGKYAAHMVRLGIQGMELMTTGHITLPMTAENREICVGLRLGDVELDYALTEAGKMAKEIRDLAEHGPLPERPDMKQVNEFLIDAYGAWWTGTPTDHGIRGTGKQVIYGPEASEPHFSTGGAA